MDDEALAVLLLPDRLESFERQDHARSLLGIPRVVALEPSRMRTPRVMRDGVTARQARRLRLPGRLRLIALYHPRQYPLARALVAQHGEAELWYLPPAPAALASARDLADLRELDELARHRADGILEPGDDTALDDEPLRERLRSLEVINPYAFTPRTTFRWARDRHLGRSS